MCWSRNAARILLVIPVFVLALMAHAGEQFPGKVVGISDGDTISVLRKGKAVKVRLYGIDTLESKQAFGTRARQYTSDLAFGQVVTVAVKDHDRYGRLVAEVFLPDGRSLNQELVQAGMAWWYTQFAPQDTLLQQLEAEARQAKRGLWSDPHAVLPVGVAEAAGGEMTRPHHPVQTNSDGGRARRDRRLCQHSSMAAAHGTLMV